MKILPASHLDHNLSPEHLAWLLEHFADRTGLFLETVTIPDHLGELDSALYGPLLGDEPVAEADVTYVIRGNRSCASRMVNRPMRKTRLLTVVAGPHGGDPCVLYTSYGGPQAPREPGDQTLASWDLVVSSRLFWAEHALAR